jgi:hypothetical protein
MMHGMNCVSTMDNQMDESLPDAAELICGERENLSAMDNHMEDFIPDAAERIHANGDNESNMGKHMEEPHLHDLAAELNHAEEGNGTSMANRMEKSPSPDAAELNTAEADGENSVDTHDEQTEALVCSVCGCTPCEWSQYGLSVINLMTHAFDHTNLLINGRLIDPVSHSRVEGNVARRVAHKCFQYEKYGSMSVGK